MVPRPAYEYETLARNFPNGAVLLFDRNLRHTIADGVGLAALGVTKEALEGRTLFEAFPEPLARVLAPAYLGALDGRAGNFELKNEERIHSLQVIPVRDAAGAIWAETSREDFTQTHDVMNVDLLRWVSSNLTRMAYVDEALEEYGMKDLAHALMAGQAAEMGEVYDYVLSGLEAQVAADEADQEDSE